jgi:hypothetical protein
VKVSRKVYFLVLIIEECAEIIHRTCKAIRFGLDERWKPESGTNRELLQEEMIDLQAVLDMNVREGNIVCFEFDKIRDHVSMKTKKVDHYFSYSEKECLTITYNDTRNPSGVYSVWKEANPVE